jgi:hypothetical protein
MNFSIIYMHCVKLLGLTVDPIMTSGNEDLFSQIVE